MPKVGRNLETILRISVGPGTSFNFAYLLGQLWGSFATALGQLWNSSGMMTTTMMIFVFQFYIYKLPINRPSGRYVMIIRSYDHMTV